MTKIVFDDGRVIFLRNIAKMYMQPCDCEKIIPVASISDCKPITMSSSGDLLQDKVKEGIEIIRSFKDEAINELMHVGEPGNCSTCVFSDLCAGQPEEVGIECQQ